MEALLQMLLRISGNFEPITSAQVLAILGVVALALGFSILATQAGTAAATGAANLITGLRGLITGLALGIAALLMLYLSFCLVRGALTHILQ